MAKSISVTESGLEKYKKELEYLKNDKRKEVAEKLRIARSFGDLSENSEYDAAKNEQAQLEANIAELEDMINNANVISDEDISTDTVNIGVTVVLLDQDKKKNVEYTLVSPREVNIAEHKISDQSPIGKKLIGAKRNDSVVVETPNGSIRHFKVMEIKKD